MKKDLTCSIVQDLLPNYIEKLTGDDTNHTIEEHLITCESCTKEYNQMTAEIINQVKIPIIELKFLKKVKMTRILAAVFCVILTLVLSYLIYASEYHYALEKSELSSAITEFTTPFDPSFDAYVLDTKVIGRTLIVSFKDQANEDIYGVTELQKGWNQKYRIIRTHIQPSDYSSVVQFYRLEIKKQRYYAVNGYNLASNIRFYGLDYSTYKNPGTLSDDEVTQSIQFDVKNPQFLEIYPADKLDDRMLKESKDTVYEYHLIGTSLYDASGNDITDNFRNESESNRGGSGAGKAELFLLYVYIAIIMGLGIILTRYFLTD